VEWIDTTDITDANVDRAPGPGLDGSSCRAASAIAAPRARSPASSHCRETTLPYLGICLGFQMAVIEFARNVLGIEDANSTEFDPDAANRSSPSCPSRRRSRDSAARCGSARRMCSSPGYARVACCTDHESRVHERFRHRYEVDPAYIERLRMRG
jgi:CTP synthase